MSRHDRRHRAVLHRKAGYIAGVPLPIFLAGGGDAPIYNWDITRSPGGPQGWDVVRAGTATYWDSAGVLRNAGVNTYRVSYDPVTLALEGLLIEGGRFNSLRNNTMAGTVNGVIGSGGALPNNWTSGALGLTTTILGTTIEDGIECIDIQFSGTTTSAGDITVVPESTTQIAAVTAQVWAGSFFLRLMGGDFTNISGQKVQVTERTAAGATVTSGSAPAVPTGAALRTQRFSYARPFDGGGTVARTTTEFRAVAASGVLVNFTIRIGLPQLEGCETAAPFASSPIRTLGAAGVQRSTDKITTTVAALGMSTSRGAIFVEAKSANGPQTSSFARAFSFDNGLTNTETVNIARSSGVARGFISTGGVTSASPVGGVWADSSILRCAMSYVTDSVLYSSTTGNAAADTSAAMPTDAAAAAALGGRSDQSVMWFGHLRKLKLFAQPQPQATLNRLVA